MNAFDDDDENHDGDDEDDDLMYADGSRQMISEALKIFGRQIEYE